MALNGATIIDGPELVWQDDFKETWGGVKDSEGYSCRNWETREQYVNDTLNFFHKIIDGTIRIPSRPRQQHLLLRRNGRRVKKNIEKKRGFESSSEHKPLFADTFILGLRNQVQCSFT